MYELTQQFIQKQLDDPRLVLKEDPDEEGQTLGWTDRQREMLGGMSDYLGDVQGDFEGAIDGLYNPGLQEEVPIPEDLDDIITPPLEGN